MLNIVCIFAQKYHRRHSRVEVYSLTCNIMGNVNAQCEFNFAFLWSLCLSESLGRVWPRGSGGHRGLPLEESFPSRRPKPSQPRLRSLRGLRRAGRRWASGAGVVSGVAVSHADANQRQPGDHQRQQHKYVRHSRAHVQREWILVLIIKNALSCPVKEFLQCVFLGGKSKPNSLCYFTSFFIV